MMTVALAVSRFFTWWSGELASCVPDRLRRLLRSESSLLVITIGSEVAQVTVRSGGRVRQLGCFPLAAASRRTLTDLVGGTPSRSLQIVVNVPRDKVLRRSVTLPLEVAENLREVLAFQMDRHTPFKASEVAYDYRVTATDTAAKKITVDLAVLQRTTLDEATSIVDSYGLTAHRVGIADDDPGEDTPFNFRPHEDLVIPSAARRRLVVTLTMAAAFLAAVAWYLPLYFDHRALAMYEARLEETRAAALQADSLKKRLVTEVDVSQALVDRRAATPTLTSLIADITNRLPDGTWLTQLQVRDGTLTLTGFSVSAAPLIARLEASPLLAQVRFGSPVTPDQSVGSERFNIIAQVALDRSS
jgi:general secretion pathway protein L